MTPTDAAGGDPTFSMDGGSKPGAESAPGANADASLDPSNELEAAIAEAGVDPPSDAAEAALDASTSTWPEAGSPAHQGDAAQESELPVESVKLCREEGELSVYLTRYFDGFLPGAQFVFQNGFYTLIDGSCTAYCQDGYGRAFTRDLDDSDRASVEATLSVSKLQSLAGTHVVHECDGPREILEVDGYLVGIVADCQGGTQREDSEASALIVEVHTAIGGCGAEQWGWRRVRQGVRFNLVSVEEGLLPDDSIWFRNAPEWPLSSDPADLAKPEDDPQLVDPDQSLLLDESESAPLVEIWDGFLAGEFGFEGDRYIPIEQADGTRYRLYVRDVIPLEDPAGRLPFRR